MDDDMDKHWDEEDIFDDNWHQEWGLMKTRIDRVEGTTSLVEIIQQEHSASLFADAVRMEKPHKSGQLKEWHADAKIVVKAL